MNGGLYPGKGLGSLSDVDLDTPPTNGEILVFDSSTETFKPGPDTAKDSYKGVYDASTNTPTLINGTGTNADYHRVNVDGTQDFGDGNIVFDTGDLVLYNGTLDKWEKVDGNPDLVVSVAGKQGAVTLEAADITDFDTAVAANGAVTANTAKVTNATHTSEVTGATALTVNKIVISNKVAVTPVAGDQILIGDASDTDNLKKVDASNFLTLDATTILKGKVELATQAEVDAGTDAVRVITPDTLAGSYAGTKTLTFYETNLSANLSTGDKKAIVHIGPEMDGMNLVAVHALVDTAGGSGLATFQIRNITKAQDMLSTLLTIDGGETGSETATTPAVIDGATDDVSENDIITLDVDTVPSGPPAKGLLVNLTFRRP